TEHGRLVPLHAKNEVAVTNGDELVQRVHHLKEVERHDVERIDLERLLEHGPRARLVAGAQQMGAEVPQDARVVLVESQAASGEFNGLVEAVVVRGQLTG